MLYLLSRVKDKRSHHSGSLFRTQQTHADAKSQFQLLLLIVTRLNTSWIRNELFHSNLLLPAHSSPRHVQVPLGYVTRVQTAQPPADTYSTARTNLLHDRFKFVLFKYNQYQKGQEFYHLYFETGIREILHFSFIS